MIRVLIVEDNEVVRKSLAAVLPTQADFEVVGQAANGLEAIAMLQEGLFADVALVDVNMPNMDGFELTERLSAAFPTVKVVILTMHDKSEFYNKAASTGAKGYVLKHGEMDELYEALKSVYAGKSYFEEQG